MIKPKGGERMPQDNSVLIGKKPVMNYVLACLVLFENKAENVYLKARGRAISRAVDVAEIVRRRFLKDVKVKKIDIGTDKLEFDDEDRGKVQKNVSTIEITLSQ
jgi:DNA-binding protein